MRHFTTFCYVWASLVFLATGDQWQMPDNGLASMSHYDLPVNFVASCGCSGNSSGNYPTAALNQLALGTSEAYGPGCGRCFNLTLLDTWTGTPPFYPTVHPSVVIKVTDLCPAYSAHCQATASKPNEYGFYVHFDLAYPSPAIPTSFFPTNVPLYGYSDFGVWNISYQSVPCVPDWAGSSNASALGPIPDMGSAVCCPAEPTANNTYHNQLVAGSACTSGPPLRVENASTFSATAAMSKGNPYMLRLVPESEQDTFRLLELPADLVSMVENGSPSELSLTIKGKHSDDAVLCTSSSTHALKAVVLSNSFLVVSSYVRDPEVSESENMQLEIRGQVKEIIEVVPAIPRLDRLGGLLKGSEWKGDDDDDLRDDRPAKRRRYTYEQACGLVQASEAELAIGLKRAHVLNIHGELRPLPPSQLSSILEALLTSLVIHSFSPNYVPLNAFLDAVEDDHDLPREVIRGVLTWFGDVSGEGWRADVEALVREVGLGILADHWDDPLEESHFMVLWENKVGDTFSNEVSLQLLAGHYLPPLPPSRKIKYFSHTALPTTTAARFADLFLARPRWRADDLEPFLRGLPGGEEKAGRDAMLVKFARRSEGDDGVWWSSRANYS